MDLHTQIIFVLTGLVVLSGTAVVVWCIATDDRYMDNWRDQDEKRYTK